jgi:hypothetical protein
MEPCPRCGSSARKPGTIRPADGPAPALFVWADGGPARAPSGDVRSIACTARGHIELALRGPCWEASFGPHRVSDKLRPPR